MQYAQTFNKNPIQFGTQPMYLIYIYIITSVLLDEKFEQQSTIFLAQQTQYTCIKEAKLNWKNAMR